MLPVCPMHAQDGELNQVLFMNWLNMDTVMMMEPICFELGLIELLKFLICFLTPPM